MQRLLKVIEVVNKMFPEIEIDAGLGAKNKRNSDNVEAGAGGGI